MFDYLGTAHAGLAWLAWRREAPTEAEQLAQAALADWNKHPFPYPLYWQALWPLLGLYLSQERLAEALACARQLLDPGQQPLPASLAESLTAALSAGDDGRPNAARQLLHHALTTAQQMNFT
jgi:hypothetical protein